MTVSWLRMDLSPLASRDFRVLFGSSTITLLGTEATDVALVVQVKQLTGSTLAVGLLGAAELVPLVVFALYGGVLADRLDRRQVIRWCEAALGGCSAAAAGRLAAVPATAVAALRRGGGDERAGVAAASLGRGHDPAHRAPSQLTAAVTLSSGSQNLSVIVGSSLGGVLAAGAGPAVVYALDAATFVVSSGLLFLLRPVPAPEPPALASGAPSPENGLRACWPGCATPGAAPSCWVPTWPTWPR